jgi:glutathione peroxidase
MLAARTVRYSWPPIRRTMSARESATVDRDHLKSETGLWTEEGYATRYSEY